MYINLFNVLPVVLTQSQAPLCCVLNSEFEILVQFLLDCLVTAHSATCKNQSLTRAMVSL